MESNHLDPMDKWQRNLLLQSIQQLTGNELRNELHEIIKAHNEFSYSSTKNILRLADQDPDNENNIIHSMGFRTFVHDFRSTPQPIR